MKIFVMVCALALGLSAQSAPATAAGRAGQNVVGTVSNQTTGQPLANATLTLVRLQNGMQPVATTTSDAGGHYRFSESGPGPYMVQTDFDGVTYYARATAGESETDLHVYASSSEAARMQVDAEIMVLQPSQGQLAIVNEYRVDNLQQPPRTLVRKGGMFRFRVASGATVDMVRVVGPGEMPLSHPALPTAEHDVYSIATPLRPGETRIQISYRIPYANLKAAITETPIEPTAHFEVYVPAPMTFSGPGLVQLGEQDGYKVYGLGEARTQVSSFHFSVSGDAPIPAAAAQAAGVNADSGAGSGASADASAGSPGGMQAGAEASAPVTAGSGIVPTPTFLERNRWSILALLAIAVAVGFGLLLAKPADPVPGATDTALAYPLPQLPAAAPAADELTRLKDDLFLLEVQHHTGRVPEDEYQRQRAALNTRMTALAQALTPPRA